MTGSFNIDFSHSFCGRQEELRLLKETLKLANTTTEQRKPPRIFVQGNSGIGKSLLIDKFLTSSAVKTIKGGSLYGSGKICEGNAESEPFAALITAVQQVVDHLQETCHKEGTMESWKQRLQDSLGKEISVLVTVLRFGDLVNRGEEEKETITRQQGGFNDEANSFGFDRLRFAFCLLLKTISSQVFVVLFIDDLQWAQQETLAFIKTLLEDPHLMRFLFIGAHRPLEQSHQLEQFKKDSQTSREIVLSGLSENDINEMLCQLLRREPEHVANLAHIISQKTRGNSFFVEQFIRLIEKQNLLHFSMQTFQWEWDIDRILGETDISDDVAVVVSSKIRNSNVATALQIASCLGVTFFDVDTLERAIQGAYMTKSYTNDVGLLLEQLYEAAREGFVEELSQNQFKFAHDRIREAAYSLLPTGQELSELQLQIGRQLRAGLPRTDEDWDDECYTASSLLFLAARELNAGSVLMTDSCELEDLAQLNYRAADLAMQRASYVAATDFLEAAIRLLRDDPWKNHLDFMLKLSTALARSLYCCGLLKESSDIAGTIIDNARNVHEKNTASHIKILCLTLQRKFAEALELANSSLSELGVKMPRKINKFIVIREFLQTKKMLRNFTDEELLNMPMATDEKTILVPEFFIRVGEIGLAWGNTEVLGLSILKGLQTHLQVGRLSHSSMTLQIWAGTLIKQGNLPEAKRYASIGLKMAKELRNPKFDYRAISIYHSWVSHWDAPYQTAITQFGNANEALWSRGCLSIVLLQSHHTLRMHFCCGLRLEPLLEDIRQYVDLMNDYKQDIILDMNVAFLQMVSNLCGRVKCPTDLTGEYMNQEESIASWTKNGSDAPLEMFYFQKMILGIYFDDSQLAVEMSAKIRQMFLSGSETFVPYRFFFKAIAALSPGKQRKRKHVKQGRKIIKTIESWVKQGNVNAHHMLLILQAMELSVSSRDEHAVQQAFDKAIVASGRLGFLHNQALANHRAGLYFLEKKDTYNAMAYLGIARDLYTEWGAVGVAQHLTEKYSGLLDSSTRFTSRSSSLLAVRRLCHISRETRKSTSQHLSTTFSQNKTVSRDFTSNEFTLVESSELY